MSLVLTTSKPKNSRVYLPANFGLPMDFLYGSVSISMSFEGHPSGSIKINNIPESKIDAYRAAYRRDKKFTLNLPGGRGSLFFIISSVSESFNELKSPGIQPIRVWDLSVSLEGGNQNRCGFPIRVNERPKEFDRTVSLGSIARKAGLKYSGHYSKMEIPANSAKDLTATFDNEVKKKLRIKGNYLDYNGKTIRSRSLSSGASHVLTENDVEYAIDSSTGKKNGFRKAKITGKDNPYFLTEKEIGKTKMEEMIGDVMIAQSPKKVVLKEGDEDPTRPPKDCIKIKSLDLNYDMSGPRKTTKKTTYLDGQIVKEEVSVYGLVYKSTQVENPKAKKPTAPDTEPALLGDPGDYWRQIEYKKTEHIYKRIKLKVSIDAKDKESKKKYRVHYADDKVQGRNARFFPNRYLTEIRTTGWALVRHKQETADASDYDLRIVQAVLDDPESTQDEIEYFELIKKALSFYKSDIYESKKYRLEPQDHHFNDPPAVPFQTQLVNKKDVGLGGKGQVVVAIPDPNYVYPMLVMAETSLKSTFSVIKNPENYLIGQDRKAIREDPSLSQSEKEQALYETPYIEDLITGEDSFEIIKRKVTSSTNTTKNDQEGEEVEGFDIYVEYQHKASSQDAQFQNTLQEGTYRQVLGRPPQGSVFKQVFKPKPKARKRISNRNKRLWYISSTSNKEIPEYAQSFSFDTNKRSEAIRAAKYTLAIQNLNGWKSRSANLYFFYPEMRPGDFVTFRDMNELTTWRITGVSFNLDFNGYLENERFITCDSTSVNLGVYEVPTIRSSSEKDDEKKDGDLDITARIRGDKVIGELDIPTKATRRNRRNDPFRGTDTPIV